MMWEIYLTIVPLIFSPVIIKVKKNNKKKPVLKHSFQHNPIITVQMIPIMAIWSFE